MSEFAVLLIGVDADGDFLRRGSAETYESLQEAQTEGLQYFIERGEPNDYKGPCTLLVVNLESRRVLAQGTFGQPKPVKPRLPKINWQYLS